MVRKILKILQGIIVIVYILINVYLILLNLKTFRTSAELNLGFKTWNTSLALFLFFFGLLSLLTIWLLSYIKDLKDENVILKREEEIRKLKSGGSKKELSKELPDSDEDEDYV